MYRLCKVSKAVKKWWFKLCQGKRCLIQIPPSPPPPSSSSSSSPSPSSTSTSTLLSCEKKRLQHGAGLMWADTKQYHVGYCSRHRVRCEKASRLDLWSCLAFGCRCCQTSGGKKSDAAARGKKKKTLRCIYTNISLDAGQRDEWWKRKKWTRKTAEYHRLLCPTRMWLKRSPRGRPPGSFNNIAYSFSAFLKDNLPSICLPTIPRFSAVNESDQLRVLSE